MMSVAVVTGNIRVGSYEDAEEMRKIYQPKVEELEAISREIAEKGIKDKNAYLVSGSAKLISMMLDCEQYFTEVDSNPILVDRVIKVHRFISNFDLHRYGVNHVVIGGMFMTVPMYLLPAYSVNAAKKNRYGAVMDPESHGLPGHDVVDYATYRPLTGSTYTAIAKFGNSVLNHWISSARHYEYVFLK